MNDESAPRERIGYDALYKQALGSAPQLAQFLQTFDPGMADILRLDTLVPRDTELVDRVPADYERRADIVAQVARKDNVDALLLVHIEVQRTRQADFGWRMLDYYALLRRTGLRVLPYAVLLYPDNPALGEVMYTETVDARPVAALTYRQISLPALDASAYTQAQTHLGRAPAATMRLPESEGETQTIYRSAITAILEQLKAGASEDAAVALWGIVHLHFPGAFERIEQAGIHLTLCKMRGSAARVADPTLDWRAALVLTCRPRALAHGA